MADVEAEVEAFVHEYGEVFSTADPALIASHFHEPATVVSAAGVNTLGTRAGVERLFGAVLEDLEDREYAYSEATDVDVDPIGADRAVVDVHWVRYTTDDAVLEHLDTTHVFRRTDDGWKMVVLLPHD